MGGAARGVERQRARGLVDAELGEAQVLVDLGEAGAASRLVAVEQQPRAEGRPLVVERDRPVDRAQRRHRLVGELQADRVVEPWRRVGRVEILGDGILPGCRSLLAPGEVGLAEIGAQERAGGVGRGSVLQLRRAGGEVAPPDQGEAQAEQRGRVLALLLQRAAERGLGGRRAVGGEIGEALGNVGERCCAQARRLVRRLPRAAQVALHQVEFGQPRLGQCLLGCQRCSLAGGCRGTIQVERQLPGIGLRQPGCGSVRGEFDRARRLARRSGRIAPRHGDRAAQRRGEPGRHARRPAPGPAPPRPGPAGQPPAGAPHRRSVGRRPHPRRPAPPG